MLVESKNEGSPKRLMLAFALFFRGVEGHKPSIAGLTVLASANLAHHLVIILAPQKTKARKRCGLLVKPPKQLKHQRMPKEPPKQ